MIPIIQSHNLSIHPNTPLLPTCWHHHPFPIHSHFPITQTTLTNSSTVPLNAPDWQRIARRLQHQLHQSQNTLKACQAALLQAEQEKQVWKQRHEALVTYVLHGVPRKVDEIKEEPNAAPPAQQARRNV